MKAVPSDVPGGPGQCYPEGKKEQEVRKLIVDPETVDYGEVR